MRTHKQNDTWQPVGGGIDFEDESPAYAAAREVAEEIGIMVQPQDLKLITTAPFDFGIGTVYCFLASFPSDAKIQVDTIEIAEFKWLTINEARQLPMHSATRIFIEHLVQSEAANT